ncbi:stage IV sporulation protein FA [Alkalibacillus flavidus]|uniref:Stage IV sporulation protein FA n=1 Tax=Alkalibacillus flavidus TaxID=546021 RepID=A0ABV2KVC3_9BACI
MDRRLQNIRQNIAKRRSMQRRNVKHNTTILPTREESHGFSSIPQSEPSKTSDVITPLLKKAVVALGLFAMVLIINQSSASWMKEVDNRVNGLLTEDLPFATVQAWYDAHIATMFVSSGFDAPVNEPTEPDQAVLASGIQENRVTSNDDHVLIDIMKEQTVHPVERGTVLFAGTKPDTGKTVIIQHEDGRQSIYGHLSEIDVFHYQFVDPSNDLGTIRPDSAIQTAKLYFALENRHQSLDPVPVILDR